MTRHYIFIRRDLPIGTAMAQVVHASGESATLYSANEYMTLYRATLPAHTISVVLEVEDEYALFRVQKLLQVNNIPHVSIVESDKPYDQQLMAIGLVPTDSDAVVKLMKPFKLLTKLEG